LWKWKNAFSDKMSAGEEKNPRERIAVLEAGIEELVGRLRKANDMLERETAARLQLEKEILEAGQRERQRIGRDLHDGLGPQLIVISYLNHLLANSLASTGSPEAGRAADVSGLLDHALALTRSLARGLHPDALKSRDLCAALAALAEQTTAIFKIHCHFTGPEDEPALDDTAATHLHAIAREAVTNAVKHAGATTIRIKLEARPDGLRLEVADDGCGMPAKTNQYDGTGMRIMKYRADMIGGSLDVSSNGARGSIVACAVPEIRKPIP